MVYVHAPNPFAKANMAGVARLLIVDDDDDDDDDDDVSMMYRTFGTPNKATVGM